MRGWDLMHLHHAGHESKFPPQTQAELFQGEQAPVFVCTDASLKKSCVPSLDEMRPVAACRAILQSSACSAGEAQASTDSNGKGKLSTGASGQTVCLGMAWQAIPKVTFFLRGIEGSIPLRPAWVRNAMTLQQHDKTVGAWGKLKICEHSSSSPSVLLTLPHRWMCSDTQN